MTKKAFFLLLLFLAQLSCQKKEAKIEYRVSDDQLIHLMYDVQFSDIAMAGISGEEKDTLKTLFWEKLKAIYGLSESEIKAEILKLESDPEKMKIVFDSIKIWTDTIQ